MIDAGDELGVCAINVAEFYSGVPEDARDLWDEFFASIGYWHITQDIARRAGLLRHEYSQIGRALSTTDTLIAAVAETNGSVIVTNNVKDYPMPNLSILSFLDITSR
jgi:predicted nucleic acid-binding protein